MTAPPLPETLPADVAGRAEATRRRILDATVASLMDQGYAATTTTTVQRRAGVSRGALMHHFPSKQELLLEAVVHLVQERGRWLEERVRALPPEADRIASGLELLWGAMSGPLFAAATELWIAARTDESLRQALIPHERALGAGTKPYFAQVFGLDPEEPAFQAAFDYVLQVFRGAALTTVLRDDARWERQLVATTAELFRQIYDDHRSRTTTP